MIQYLFEHDKAFDVAKSIAHRGYFANEPLLAIKESGMYVIVEGNRRLAALKALRERGRAMRRKILCSLVVAGLCLVVSVPVSGHEGELQATFSYDSEVGDYIGGGNSATWTEAEGRWSPSRNFDNGVSLRFLEDSPGISSWTLDFAAPDEVELSVSSYPSAERFPFQSAGKAGLAVSGEGRGCNTLIGSFDVTDVRFDWFGEPVRLNATFEQHCEGASPALTGSIDFAEGVLGPTGLGSGNVLVMADRRVWEYTLGGVLVREIPIMESTGTFQSGTEYPRDMVMDSSGRVHIFNGTFDPFLSSFTPSSGLWQHNSVSGWGIFNVTTSGKIAAFGDYVFAPNELTDTIVRFDAANGYIAEHFPGAASVFEYLALAVGLDGRLYALVNDKNTVDIFLPVTMEKVGQVILANNVQGIAVDAQGTIFGAGNDFLYRFDASGAVAASFNPPGVNSVHDIDISRSGQIVASGSSDDVFIVTDTSFSSSSAFATPVTSGSVFVALVQTPPGSLFNGGFESGGTSLWSMAVGEVAGFLNVNAGSAQNGTSGLEVTLGATCTSDQNLNVNSPVTISGVFEGCNSVTASGVEVVSPGATFQAGSIIALGNNFSVAASASLQALIDPALVDGFAFVQDDSPEAEKRYHARFAFRLDDATIGDSDMFDLFSGFDASGGPQFRVILKRNAMMGENRMVLAARENGGGSVETPFGAETLIPVGWNVVEVDWKAGAADGFLMISLNGAPFIGLSPLNNDLGQVDSVRWGVVDGAVSGSSGDIDLDDFFSWN